MLFQQNYLPGALPADKLYLQSLRQKQFPSQRHVTVTNDLYSQQQQQQQQQQHYISQDSSAMTYQLGSGAMQDQSSQMNTAFNEYQQLYQQFYQQQKQQLPQQPSPVPHYIPSIMVPPQSPTLASYYFEGSNRWVNHYYDPKRRQYLSSRVEPFYHERHQGDTSTLPNIESLGLNPQQLQLALQQQQQQQQQHQHHQHHQHQQQHLLHLQQHAMPIQGTDVKHYRTPMPMSSQHYQFSQSIQTQQQQASFLNTQSLMSANEVPALSNPYLAMAAASSSSSSALSQPAVLPHLSHSLSATEYTEEWRESMLQYAHSLYTTSPHSPQLLPLLHSIHSKYPTHLPTLLLLACVYYMFQDYQASLQYNQLILKYDPKYVEAMSNIGTTLRGMGQTAEAEKWWFQAVKLRPGYWDAVENLVGVLCSSSPNSAAANSAANATDESLLSAETQYPRYKEALAVCEFVEQYFYKPHQNEGAQLTTKAPKQLPIHQLPRLQNLFYAKGNLKYALGNILGARQEYEKGLELVFNGSDLVSIASHIACACGSSVAMEASRKGKVMEAASLPLILLQPDQAVRIFQIAFSQSGGVLPALAGVDTVKSATAGDTGAIPNTLQQANQTTSTILLTLAKLFQDLMNPTSPALSAAASSGERPAPSMSLLLPLYYLSLALHPSPSTANNLGIILSNISPATAALAVKLPSAGNTLQTASGTYLAMQYYTYGLQLDPRHPHLYTNMGSLLKDMGHLNEAVSMYEKAVEFNPRFDVALANLGNAIKDMGRVQDSIQWYRSAVEVNPNFVDAVCGLVNSLGGVCDWRGRGGVGDEPTVDQLGKFFPSTGDKNARSGWIGRVVDIVEKQLNEGAVWGAGALKIPAGQRGGPLGSHLAETIVRLRSCKKDELDKLVDLWQKRLSCFDETTVKKSEGSWLIRLVERILRRLQRSWYLEQYGAVYQSESTQPAIVITSDAVQTYQRPLIPQSLTSPPVPTVLPFHTFTYPLTPRQIRLISHRNALRISHNALTSSWLPKHVYPPPPPPSPRLRIGYVSSDFNNHPLAHLMQSVFGFHDRVHYEVFCYATTTSDNSPYRQKIERETEHFLDVSTWTNQQVVEKIVNDKIHVLVNLNGYTKGARNEIFAARPSPVQCSFMGFAGTLGGGWCDWIIADPVVCPPEMVNCELWRRGQPLYGKRTDECNGDFEGDLDPEAEREDFVYTEKFIYMPHSYFVNDHKQGFRDDGEHAQGERAALPDVGGMEQETLWASEEDRRWKMRREVFPSLPDDVVIFANFNQLYKLEPSTFRMWLRILERVPNSILWLLRFPPAGEQHLKRCATEWSNAQVAQRVVFTDVAPKHVHIHRGRVADIFLDTPECNAHTTAADILWSGTPIVTYPKYMHKMCSRVGASIALATGYGDKMVVTSEQQYEDRAVQLAQGLKYDYQVIHGEIRRRGRGAVMDLRKQLFCTREESRLFDTHRWTQNLERGYLEAWRRWVTGEEFEDVNASNTTTGCIWVTDPDDGVQPSLTSPFGTTLS